MKSCLKCKYHHIDEKGFRCTMDVRTMDMICLLKNTVFSLKWITVNQHSYSGHMKKIEKLIDKETNDLNEGEQQKGESNG